MKIYRLLLASLRRPSHTLASAGGLLLTFFVIGFWTNLLVTVQSSLIRLLTHCGPWADSLPHSLWPAVLLSGIGALAFAYFGRWCLLRLGGKKLAYGGFCFVLLMAVGFQTHTFPALDTNNIFTGNNIFAKLNGIRMASQFASGSVTGGLQEAITDCAGRCTIYVDSPLTATSTVNVNQVGIEIVGLGPHAVITVNHALDVFNVTSSLFKLRDLEVDISATAGNRLNSSIVVGAAQSGVIDNVRFVGSASVTNNGIIFKSTGNGASAGNWVISNNLIPGGVTWQNFALVTNSSAVTTSADYHFLANLGGSLTMTDAAFAFDGFLDTVKLTANDIAVSASGPAVAIRNTVSACVECPRWVHLTSNSFEAQGQTVINAASSKDLQITGGYVTSGTIGIALGSVAFGPKIQGVVFTNIGQSAVTISAGTGSYGVRILDSYFDDQCNSVTNTYDAISVAANSNDFMIRGNVFRDLNANTCAHFLNISGTSDRYMVQGNDFQGTTGTSAVTNTASGSNRAVIGNVPNGALADSLNNTLALNGTTSFNGTTQFNTKLTAAAGIAITAAQPFQMNEGANVTPVSGEDLCDGNSTSHTIQCSFNGGNAHKLPLFEYGSCAMSAATTCTFSAGASFTSTPLAFASDQSHVTIDTCSISTTTVTITANASNSTTHNCVLIGNPN